MAYGLRGAPAIVLSTIQKYYDQYGICNITREQLAEETSYHPWTITFAIKKLQRYRIIEVVRTPGDCRRSSYRLLPEDNHVL
jgi:DNA-binding MarR family transcriptional regulator